MEVSLEAAQVVRGAARVGDNLPTLLCLPLNEPRVPEHPGTRAGEHSYGQNTCRTPLGHEIRNTSLRRKSPFIVVSSTPDVDQKCSR